MCRIGQYRLDHIHSTARPSRWLAKMLIGMSERIRLIGDKFLVSSEPNRGADILAEMPLAVPADEVEAKTHAGWK
jgi:hypothetical protein